MLFYPVRCVMAYIYYVSLSDVSKSSVVEFSAVISLCSGCSYFTIFCVILLKSR